MGQKAKQNTEKGDLAFAEIADQIQPGWQARILSKSLKIIAFKKLIVRTAQKPARSIGLKVPKSMVRRYTVQVKTIAENSLATISPKNPEGKKHLLLFHGGGYIFEGSNSHWKLAEQFLKELGCRVSYLDYPLAPENNFTSTHAWVQEVYEYLMEKYPNDEFSLMGDSAGGGLALAFAQNLVEKKSSRQPTSLVLLSPWLDLSMGNPAALDNAKTDPVLSFDFLHFCALKYAGENEQKNPLCSPIFGSFDHLPKTAVFFSSQELFYADCKDLMKLTENCSSDFSFYEYPGMPHDWLIFPLPESRRAIHEISTFLK